MKPLDRALELLRSGDPLGAETFMASFVKDAAAEFGTEHPDYASAQFDLACLMLHLGDLQRAADCLREAWRVPATEPQALKDRLTYNMNLGEVLTRQGQSQQAGEVLREGLALRESFYGREHPGYAYGLEPLAETLLARGEVAEARPLVEEAARNLWNHGHDHVAEVLALRTYVLVAAEAGTEEIYELPARLPDELFDRFALRCVARAEHSPAALGLAVLLGLQRHIEARDEAGQLRWFQVMAGISNTARELGEHALRVRAFDEMLVHERGPQRLDMLLGRALAHSDRKDLEAADADYRAAREHAGEDRALVSHVCRNHGLMFSEAGLHDQAERLLAEAVEAASQAGHDELLARALIARGIFLQHRGELEQARGMLEMAVSSLPPEDHEGLAGRSHLDAIVEGRSCGCGDMSRALGQALRELVLPHVPQGLVRHLDLDAQTGGVTCELSREATQVEMELLDRVLRQAISTLRSGE
jgi:tetratricopeptide (TPR) repeat protein